MIRDPIVLRLIKVFGVVLSVAVVGTVGYCWLEGWPLQDGLFMTVITLSTVGYGETHALSPTGRGFTSVLIFACLITMTCWIASLTSFMVENDLSGRYLRKRHLKMISNLKNHTIVCGATLLGKAVIERLLRTDADVVLVEEYEAELARMCKRYPRLLTVEGSATNEVLLAQANLLKADHVVAALDDELSNLLVAITCKDIGRNVKVFARSTDATVANRMRKAMVDEVISPCHIAGGQIADMIIA